MSQIAYVRPQRPELTARGAHQRRTRSMHQRRRGDARGPRGLAARGDVSVRRARVGARTRASTAAGRRPGATPRASPRTDLGVAARAKHAVRGVKGRRDPCAALPVLLRSSRRGGELSERGALCARPAPGPRRSSWAGAAVGENMALHKSPSLLFHILTEETKASRNAAVRSSIDAARAEATETCAPRSRARARGRARSGCPPGGPRLRVSANSRVAALAASYDKVCAPARRQRLARVVRQACRRRHKLHEDAACRSGLERRSGELRVLLSPRLRLSAARACTRPRMGAPSGRRGGQASGRSAGQRERGIQRVPGSG